MKLIGPLVLLGLLSLVEGELSAGFTNCRQEFFINNNAPNILKDQNNPQKYQEICQRYGPNVPYTNHNYRYATLYDTANRIPVYSAYWYSGRGCDKKRCTWMIEPQLDGGTDVNMETQSAANLRGPLQNQAVDEDYPKKPGCYGLQRGHLYPHSHNTKCDSYQTRSTYTLTNAAPQRGDDNKQWFHQVEKKMADYIDYYCHNKQAYIVTGVVRGNNFMNNRVNIPAYFWSAFCCEDNPGNYISGGVHMQMGMGAQAQAQWVTIDQLNADLTSFYSQASPFRVFGKQPGCS